MATKGQASPTPLIEALVSAWSIPELRRRLLFVFAMFGVYVLALHIPVPSINHAKLAALFQANSSGILGMVDMFSGGALKQGTILAMGIVPYINASIIMQLMTFALPNLQELAKEGESGRRQIAKYTRWLTIGLAILQSFGTSALLRSAHILDGGFGVTIQFMILLIAGTCFAMWLGEQITQYGIGNGISLIIFCSIMVRLPQQMVSLGTEVQQQVVHLWQVLLLFVAFICTVIAVVYVTLGQRRIPIQHVKKIVGNRMTQGGTSYLPFRVASAGVIPIIFATSIQLLPVTFASFLPVSNIWHARLQGIADAMSPGRDPFSLMGLVKGLAYALIIIFFTYFYTAVTINVEEVTDNLKKYGSYIPGIRPGKATLEYLDRVMTRITLAGAIFLALIALLSYWIPALTGTAGAFSLIGGTSLLIVVGVALDTMQAIEAQLLMRNYEGFIK